MAKTLQFRRGTTSELSSVTGSVGELFVNTEKDTVVVMDGSTSGGFELVNLNASQTLTNKTLTSPVISTISNTGTLTLPTSTGTVALTSDIPTNNNQLTNGAGYLTAETNDLTSAVTWADVPDANITQSSVTQHQAALSITESQISDLTHYTNNDVDTHLNTSTASSGEVLSWNGSDYDWVAQSGGGGGLSNIVEDTTPQLGGTLDANGYDIDMGTNTITDIKVASWDAAVSWGDHNTLGYLTSADISTSTSGSNALITVTDSNGMPDSITLAAGSNITITESGDTITIASTASGSALTIQDEGSTLSTAATTLNFVGAGVTASGTGSTKTITISGGASTIGALNDVTITSPVINQVLKYNGSAWVNAADATGSGSADLGAVAEDILPSFDEIYDIGSSTFKWYDGFFTNSINLDTIALTNSSGTLLINSDVIVGSLLVDSLLLSENTITADASTALQYLGDKGVVEINSSNLDVREGDWIGVPVVETVDSVPPLTTGAEGIIRYNKDEGRFEGYSAEGWASLGGLETNADGDSVITGNLVVSGDITSTSDETLKDNIKSIEGALDTVTKLSGKMFTMKSDETQKEKVGFIAQEIEQHLPQVVSTDPNGIKSISYGNVAALLVEAIKELNQKIEDLK